MLRTHLAAVVLCLAVVCGMATAADSALCVPIGRAPRELDPCRTDDAGAALILAQVCEPLLEYDYLKRPYTLQACLAAAMPQVSADRLTWTITLKKGVRFHDDPCFPDGKGREVVAADFVLAIKRQADVAMRGSIWWLLQGKIVGAAKFRELSQRWGVEMPRAELYKNDIEGLQAVDAHTLRIRLRKPHPSLVRVLALTGTAPVAHEAVAKYGDAIVLHPIGTGPFMLKSFDAKAGVELVKNPAYRELPKRRLLAGIRFLPIAKPEDALTAFVRAQVDVLPLSPSTAPTALESGAKLLPWLDDRAVELDVTVLPSIHYLGFGMKDDTVGPNVKLRRAVSLAVSAEDIIKLHHGGLAIPAEGPFPPGVPGYDAKLRNPWRKTDLEAAAKLLAEAGFPEGKDAAGKQLELRIDVVGATRRARSTAEYLVTQLAKLGIKLHIVTNDDMVYVRKRRTGFLQIFEERADLANASTNDVLAHFFGPSKAPGPNIAHYDRRAFNELHIAGLGMAPGAEFDEVVRKQVATVIDDAVWIPLAHPVRTRLRHCWLQGVKPHALAPARMKYWKFDAGLRKTMRTLWKHDAPPKPAE